MGANKKIKDAGLSIAFAAAALAPMKSAAQDRVIDPETDKISVAVDVIRMGATIENKSSSAKEIFVHDGGFAWASKYLRDKDLDLGPKKSVFEETLSLVPTKGSAKDVSTMGIARAAASTKSDAKGKYYNLLHSALVAQSDDKYTYNTDAIYDKYLAIAKNLFKRTHELKEQNIVIHVYCVGPVDQVVVAEVTKDKEQILFGTMILDAATGDILHFSDEQLSGKSIIGDLHLVAYQLKNEEGGVAHVFDANQGMDYVYKSNNQECAIKSFQMSETNNAKPAAIFVNAIAREYTR